MPRQLSVLFALVLVVAACGGDDDAAGEGGDAIDASGATPLVIVEVDFEADRIVLRNRGESDYDLTGHWLCNRPTYVELPAEVLGAGDTIDVAASSVGLSAAGGELGVYTAREFDNPDALIRYVAWGSAGQGRQATAATAGVWGADDFVDNAGAALVSAGDNPMSSSDW